MTRELNCPTIAGVVLAGGQSSRMGRDKANLEYQGQSFLDRAQSLLLTVGCSPVLISGRPDLPGGIQDHLPGQGPALSMLDALTAVSPECKGVLFIPVDMPLLQSVDLLPLISGQSGKGCAWINHPLPTFIPTQMGMPSRSDVRSVKYLLACLEIDWLDLPADRDVHFSNVNSPEDLTGLSHSG